jgi:hypothetical protein
MGSLKGHTYEKVCAIIPLNHRFSLNKGTSILFKCLKWFVKKIRFLRWVALTVGSSDLQEFATARSQNFYTCPSSALCSVGVS